MPVYLVHGFRWPRAGFTGIRVHAVANNLEDCSVEYIQNEHSKLSILQSFRDAYAEIMQQLEDPNTGRTLDFIEQYDPQDELSETAVSHAYAFVANRVVTIAAGANVASSAAGIGGIKQTEGSSFPQPVDLQPNTTPSISQSSKQPPRESSTTASHTLESPASTLYLNLEEAMSNAAPATPKASEALAQLRDKIAEGEKIGWWVVYNGDPERPFDTGESETVTDVSSYEQSDEEVESERHDEGHTEKPSNEGETVASSKFLNQPFPSLIPMEIRHLVTQDTRPEHIVPEPEARTAKPTPPQEVPKSEAAESLVETTLSTKSKSAKSAFSFPLRRKTSKPGLPSSKADDIPEPPTLKEIGKKEGRRYRFFGSKADKKAT